MKKFGLLAFGLIASLVLSELISGYWAFLLHTRNETGLTFAYHQIFPPSPAKDLKKIENQVVSFAENNPFIVPGMYSVPNFYYQIHPFIDFSGMQTLHPKSTHLDYFGFRNDEDLYFSKPKGKLVVLTGGSEAAGFTHKRNIGARLQSVLATQWGRDVRVLNLAMASYCVANEINAYVQLAYNLKPDAVVSLSGYNDVFAGLMVPPNFKKLGFSYLKQLEVWWLPRLYQLKYSYGDPVQLNEKGADDIIESYYRGLNKYKTIVEGNGGRFIPIVQGINEGFIPKQSEFYHSRVRHYYSKLRARAAVEGVLSLQENVPIKFGSSDESMHTDEASAQLTAEFIAQQIMGSSSRVSLRSND